MQKPRVIAIGASAGGIVAIVLAIAVSIGLGGGNIHCITQQIPAAANPRAGRKSAPLLVRRPAPG